MKSVLWALVLAMAVVAALGISIGRSWQVGAAILGASAVLIGLVRFVGYFELSLLRSRQKARIRTRDAEMLRHALPELPGLLDDVRSEQELFDKLAQFAAEADLGFVEVSAGGAVAYHWSNPKGALNGKPSSKPSGKLRGEVSAAFPIGRDGLARAELRFGWSSDDSEVSPESDILLQVATDVVEASLLRLRSRLAPAVSEAVTGPSPRRTQEVLARRTG